MNKVTQQSSVSKTNYNGIDIARLICAILVMMIHVPPLGNLGGIGVFKYLNYGIEGYATRIAVPFFFVCSGFFFYRKTTLDDFNIQLTKNYVFRLLKLYIIWSAIYLPLYVEDMFKPGEKLWYFVLIYIRSFIFIGSYTQLWYFPALIFGIIITSFLLYKKVKPRTLIYLATFFYLIGLLTQSWFGIIEPLRYKSPLFWSFLKLVQSIIYTTRDGLFEGFLFVGIGMLFALKNITLSKRKALVGFIISMFLMLIEAFFLKYFSFVRESNTYLFLVPATFFGFSYVKDIKIADKPYFLVIRKMSSLIFYMHLWVAKVVNKILYTIYQPLTRTSMLFIITLFITVCISLIIIKLSEHKKFKWLKMLYV